jgi:hypothetical protein
VASVRVATPLVFGAGADSPAQVGHTLGRTETECVAEVGSTCYLTARGLRVAAF